MVEVTILEANVAVWPTVVAGTAGWLVGAIWYGVFAKPWMALAYPGKKRTEITSSNVGYFGAFVAYLVVALGVAMVASYYDAATLGDGLLVGLLLFVAFVATTFGMNYMFGGRPLKLYLIDAGNYLVSLLAIGAIIGAWQ